MRLLVAPDSFKGSLDPLTVARALTDGWARARPADDVRLIPLADGGEGTLESIKASDTGWLEMPAHARDPLDRPLEACFLRRGNAAVVEMASASGLSRLTPGERDATAASSFGTGQVLAAAIGLGAREVVIGLGGSATTDGGAGVLVALGARLLEADGRDLPNSAGGGGLRRLARLDLSGLSPVLGEVHLTVASDVSNPLLGELGAAATYGPQKGADANQVTQLDANLAHYAELLESATGTSVRNVPGAGAAGGTGAALLAIADRFASFTIRPGVEVVMELTGFDAALASADLVLTGEGHVDAQTAFGKTAQGVARRARAAGVPCICFGGGVEPAGIDALAAQGAVVVPVVERPMSVADAMAAGSGPLTRAAERTARLLTLGGAGARQPANRVIYESL
ncbi:MAG TPA: glycerate kinase [Candidatus Caenarcaniphilales bacterium]|nr:glycerate kinase [Candidatus Caenarcaniphilales bacterium]